MPIKYHIASSGRPEVCHAVVRGCPLGGEHISRAEVVRREQEDKAGSEAFDDVFGQLKEYDDVHYRVYLDKRTGEPTSVCVQSFDYYDYDGSRFLDNKAYSSELAAELAAKDFNEGESGPSNLTRAEKVLRENAQNTEPSNPFYDVVDQLENFDDVHYRLYLNPRTGEPTSICVQNFDYHDYEAVRFLDQTAYMNADEAEFAAKEFNSLGLPENERPRVSPANSIYRANLKAEDSNPFHEVSDQLENYEDVHYRVYLNRSTGEPTSVCVQYFDYLDYESARFLDKTAYASEWEAEAAARRLS